MLCAVFFTGFPPPLLFVTSSSSISESSSASSTSIVDLRFLQVETTGSGEEAEEEDAGYCDIFGDRRVLRGVKPGIATERSRDSSEGESRVSRCGAVSVDGQANGVKYRFSVESGGVTSDEGDWNKVSSPSGSELKTGGRSSLAMPGDLESPLSSSGKKSDVGVRALSAGSRLSHPIQSSKVPKSKICSGFEILSTRGRL